MVMSSLNGRSILFYDGTCGVCNRFVRFVIRHDKERNFLFAPLGGSTSLGMLAPSPAPPAESIVLVTTSGEVLFKIHAVVGVLEGLSWPYVSLAKILRRAPVALANAGYDAFARIRHRLSSERRYACPIVGAHVRERFLD